MKNAMLSGFVSAHCPRVCFVRPVSSAVLPSHGVNMTQKQRSGPTGRQHSEVRREKGGMGELREERGSQREVGNARWWD